MIAADLRHRRAPMVLRVARPLIREDGWHSRCEGCHAVGVSLTLRWWQSLCAPCVEMRVRRQAVPL